MKKLNKLLLAYILCGVLSICLNTGAELAYFQGQYPTVRHPRQDLAQALGHNILFSPVWPINTSILFFYSGFYEYGWYLVPKSNGQP